MIKDIKLAGIVPATPKSSFNGPEKSAQSTTQEGVTISTGLSRHINSLLAENSMPDENARVAEMKHRIESNNYSIDTDKLAKKIFQDMFAK